MGKNVRYAVPFFIVFFLLTSCAPSQSNQSVPANSIFSGLTTEDDGAIDAEIDLKESAQARDDSAIQDTMSGIVASGGGRMGYLLMRETSHEIVTQHDSRHPRTMASVTKLSTSLAALRNVPGVNVSDVASMLRASNNFAAAMYLRRFAKAVAGLALPAPRSKSPHSCGASGPEEASAAHLVLNWLEKTVSADWSGASLVDGNGCSDEDRMSPEQLVHLLRYADSLGPAFGGREFADLLASGGGSGTLKSRLGHLDGRARVFAKTGTLHSAITLAGYLFVPTKNGTEKFYFAILSEIDSMGEAHQGRARIDALVKSWAHNLAK